MKVKVINVTKETIYDKVKSCGKEKDTVLIFKYCNLFNPIRISKYKKIVLLTDDNEVMREWEKI